MVLTVFEVPSRHLPTETMEKAQLNCNALKTVDLGVWRFVIRNVTFTERFVPDSLRRPAT